eukprot:scpid108648/ scgid27681/ 
MIFFFFSFTRNGLFLSFIRSDKLSCEKKTAMVLYYLKDQGSYRMTCNSFGVSLPTLSRVISHQQQHCGSTWAPSISSYQAMKPSSRQSWHHSMGNMVSPMVCSCTAMAHTCLKGTRQHYENSIDCKPFCYKMKHTLN